MQSEFDKSSDSCEAKLKEALRFARISLRALHGISCIAERHGETFAQACKRVKAKLENLTAEEIEIHHSFDMVIYPRIGLLPIEVALAYCFEATSALGKRSPLNAVDSAYRYIGRAASVICDLNKISASVHSDQDSRKQRNLKSLFLEMQRPDFWEVEHGNGAYNRLCPNLPTDLRHQYLEGFKLGLKDRQSSKTSERAGKGRGGAKTAAVIRSDKEAVARLIEQKVPVKGWVRLKEGWDAIDAITPAYTDLVEEREKQQVVEKQAIEDAIWYSKKKRIEEAVSIRGKPKKVAAKPKQIATKTVEVGLLEAKLGRWIANDPTVRNAWLRGIHKPNVRGP